MPRIPAPREWGAQRCYARVRSFDCECPHCGALIVVRMRNDEDADQGEVWSPKTARLRCPKCNRQYLVGLLLWHVTQGHGAGARPMDQIPGPRELDQLVGAGWWMPPVRETGQVEISNLTNEPERPPAVDPVELDLAISTPQAWQPPEDWRVLHAQRKARRKGQP